MAKQVKVDNKKTQTEAINAAGTSKRVASRSPLTNLYIAVILFVVYLAIANQGLQKSLIYSIGAFMFFNTVDYCILYYRMNKRSK
jgi:hypothetical protein